MRERESDGTWLFYGPLPSSADFSSSFSNSLFYVYLLASTAPHITHSNLLPSIKVKVKFNIRWWFYVNWTRGGGGHPLSLPPSPPNCILKSERKILVFAIPIFLWPRISNFAGVLVFVSKLANWMFIQACACVCVCAYEEEILQKFSVSVRRVFYVFSRVLLAVKFTYVEKLYVYIHIKSHFLKDMKTPFRVAMVRGWGGVEKLFPPAIHP